jgi:glycosyltransferase involved in cell wall biosynthesis
MQLSAVVLTKNEENNIEECLLALSFCDEILVIDDNSKDKTIDTAKRLGARVYKRHLRSDFATQRNFGLKKAQGKWVLFIDADERVTKGLANEITQCVNDPILPFSGFYLKRIDEIWERKILHGECGSISLLRLVRNGSGEWRRPVHEKYEMQDKLSSTNRSGYSLWDKLGPRLSETRNKTYHLKNPLMHYPHKTLSEFIADVDRMSTIHAKANMQEKKRSNILKIIIWPPAKFIVNYIFKLGFIDGTQGFVIAAVMSFHSYLAWSKLWILQRKAYADQKN